MIYTQASSTRPLQNMFSIVKLDSNRAVKDAVARKALEEHRAETLHNLEEEQRIREEKVWIPKWCGDSNMPNL